ncbi:MAG: flagellar protein FliT [Gallionella sp.]|nr:flagellar protein FliT [Gallionella sp.]
MSAPQVIAAYESLSALTGKMRAAASDGEWDALVELEQQCSRQVAKLKPIDEVTKLDQPLRERKVQLLKKILADDADIRSHTEAWMGQLQHIMQSNRQEQRLQQVYGE